MRKRNMFIAAGLLLLSAAILMGDAGWVPHDLQLFLMGLAVAIELYGTFRTCHEKEGRGE